MYTTVSDATILLRAIAGDAASNAAHRINPNEERFNQIDQAADDNTWHDVPKVGDLKQQARDQFNKQKPMSRSDMQNAAGDASQAASGSRDPADAANQAAYDQQQGTSSIDPRGGANSAIDNLHGTASQNVPDETKDRARNLRDRSKNYAKEKFPEERRDQTIYRLKKMVVEIQSHSDCKSIDTVF